MALFDKSKLTKKASEPANSKPLVLIVDDEQANIVVLTTLLEEKFEVLAALNGKEALDKVLAMGRPLRLRAVLADQRMPVMCGTEFLEKMLGLAPNVVRILLTGYADLDSIMDSINKAQIYRYVAKPFNSQDLLLTVERAIETLELKEAKLQAEAEAKRHLELVNEALSSANNLKTLFLATISHELRTPMHGVVGNLELLNSASLSPEAKPYLFEARESAMHMRCMLDDVLLFTEIQSGDHKLTFGKFSLQCLIDDACSNIRRACEQKGLSFLCEVNSTVPTNIKSDQFLLAQILRHLLSNAVKFTDVGGVKLTVEEFRLDADEAVRPGPAALQSVTGDLMNLRFRVTDTGIGITAENQRVLFESFNQLNKKFNRRYGGLGLGLALSKQLTTLFDGDLKVESEPGKGSCFEFVLPVIAQTSTDSGTAYQPKKIDELKKRHVLVVDDNAVNRKVIEAMLARLGCRTLSAVNGLEAVEIAQNEAFDVILMDCQMPIMDGFEATEKIKNFQRHQSTPIIAFTANAAQRDREHASLSGMCDLLQKPVTLQQLSECLLKWVPVAPKPGN